MTGTAQVNRDSVDAITSRLPLVLGVIAVILSVSIGASLIKTRNGAEDEPTPALPEETS